MAESGAADRADQHARKTAPESAGGAQDEATGTAAKGAASATTSQQAAPAATQGAPIARTNGDCLPTSSTPAKPTAQATLDSWIATPTELTGAEVATTNAPDTGRKRVRLDGNSPVTKPATTRPRSSAEQTQGAGTGSATQPASEPGADAGPAAAAETQQDSPASQASIGAIALRGNGQPASPSHGTGSAPSSCN